MDGRTEIVDRYFSSEMTLGVKKELSQPGRPAVGPDRRGSGASTYA